MPIVSPVKAIRAKCIDCSAGSVEEVRECNVKDCPLYPFCMGKNPYRTPRKLTDEQKARLAEQLARGRKMQGKE